MHYFHNFNVDKPILNRFKALFILIFLKNEINIKVFLKG